MSRRHPHPVRPRAVAAALVLLAGAGAFVSLRAHRSPARVGLYATSVTYVQRWDRSGTESAPNAPGAFVVKSNLGFDVRVDRGFLVDSSASLVDCLGAGSDVWDRAPQRATAAVTSLFIGVAFAGHTQAPDPSSLRVTTLTDLTQAQGETSLGEARFPETRYCRVHFLVAGGARPSAYTATFPTVDTTRTSLHVRGAWRRGSHEWQAFELSTKSADAMLLDLPDVFDGPAEGSAAVVVLERRLATMFDDVDVGALSQAAREAAARAVLRNLDHQARVRVTAR